MTRESGVFQPGTTIAEEVALRLFLTSFPGLLDQAVTARQNAVSYRGLLVGAAAFGINHFTGESFTGSAGNIKPSKHIQTKCAETQAINSVRNAGALVVMGMVVVSTLDQDIIESVNNFRIPTLHPCHRCLSDIPVDSLTIPDTIVVSAGARGTGREGTKPSIFQVHTVEQLEFLYRLGGNPTRDQNTPLRNLRTQELAPEFDRQLKVAKRKKDIGSPAQLVIQTFSQCAA